MENRVSRRDFIKILGQAAVTGAAMGPLSTFLACASAPKGASRNQNLAEDLRAIRPSAADDLILSPGLKYRILIESMTPINAGGESFGYHPDFIGILPDPERADEFFLWVNHEYVDPLFFSNVPAAKGKKRELADVEREQRAVGGSILKIRKTARGWDWIRNHPQNRRISGLTPIPFAGGKSVWGAQVAVGTVANCGGGVTPWGTFLTCEENYSEFFGDRAYVGKKPGEVIVADCLYGWESVLSHPPEHYGWVVEVNPRTGSAKKLVSLGRFGHESATVARASDGRCVVYSGDDANDRCLYKFIADRIGSLESGTLYVANIERGIWIPLDHQKTPGLRGAFRDQHDVLLRARLAAILAGGSLLDRPEDIDIDPLTGDVLVTLTNNTGRMNTFGSILKIEEKNRDPLALEFHASTFLRGGTETGFACPDNLLFDPAGNLWFTSDMSASVMHTGEYAPFKNNGLFFVARTGPHAGKARQVASAPMGAELTGPCLSPDGNSLFLSVQHPGEGSLDAAHPTSRWPRQSAPLPAVVVITKS